jgi:8-oxo-dGTP diphosphatase
MMKRECRYQGAILRDGAILLIRHTHHEDGRTYWLIPGGGREVGETEEECVQREMREETGLEVRVERLLIEEKGRPGGVYQRMKTYLCTPVSGEASPGFEPELEASSIYAITEVRWFDLSDPASWGSELESDPITYPLMQKLHLLFV